jgi:hypothetical protein
MILEDIPIPSRAIHAQDICNDRAKRRINGFRPKPLVFRSIDPSQQAVFVLGIARNIG